MKAKDRKLIEKGLDIFLIYIKGRTIARISAGFIGGGISILGFNNLAPFVAIAIRPELVNKISLASNSLTIMGIAMILIGALIPLFLKVFNHYRQLYLEDLNRINEIYSINDYDTFIYQMTRISNNTSIFDYEIEKIEELSYLILSTDFFFNNKSANEVVKKLGNELDNFNREMSMRVSPSGISNLYNIPTNHPTFQQTATDITHDCNRLSVTYGEIKNEFDTLTKKKLMRFFK